MRFIRNPEVVDAMQFDEENRDAFAEFVGKLGGKVWSAPLNLQTGTQLLVGYEHDPATYAEIAHGQWLLFTLSRGFWVMDPKEFLETFQQVPRHSIGEGVR